MTDRVVAPKQGVVARELDGSFCLVDTDSWNVAILNETASDVWRLVDARCPMDDIVRVLAEAYHHSDLSAVSADVHTALNDLAAGGFIVISTPE